MENLTHLLWPEERKKERKTPQRTDKERWKGTAYSLGGCVEGGSEQEGRETRGKGGKREPSPEKGRRGGSYFSGPSPAHQAPYWARRELFVHFHLMVTTQTSCSFHPTEGGHTEMPMGKSGWRDTKGPAAPLSPPRPPHPRPDPRPARGCSGRAAGFSHRPQALSVHSGRDT